MDDAPKPISDIARHTAVVRARVNAGDEWSDTILALDALCTAAERERDALRGWDAVWRERVDRAEKERDAALAEEARLREIVATLEWSGQRQGPPSTMSRDDGHWFPACALCGGVKPGPSTDGSWVESATGHRKDCAFAKEALCPKQP